LWNYDADGPYEVTLYICADDGGYPYFDNPRYESGPYEPDYYYDWDEHEVLPAVQFNGGDICWVIFSVPEDDGRPISDSDGNSGHSWISDDGDYWQLMDGGGDVDWCIGVYAEPSEPPEDDDAPYISDQYPVNDDWPCGVPPEESEAGCHWLDEGSGVDPDALTFAVYDHDLNPVGGILFVDDDRIHEVIVMFWADGYWEHDEVYTVETTCYDFNGNSATDTWNFTTGYTKIEEESFGRIKAGFAG
jgi:hypothetical protein